MHRTIRTHRRRWTAVLASIVLVAPVLAIVLLTPSRVVRRAGQRSTPR